MIARKEDAQLGKTARVSPGGEDAAGKRRADVPGERAVRRRRGVQGNSRWFGLKVKPERRGRPTYNLWVFPSQTESDFVPQNEFS